MYCPVMPEISVAAIRLRQQGIAPHRFSAPTDVVRWMGAMQAQDYHQVVWASGARTADGTLTQVEKAIAAGHILRTWTQRGTIHAVAADDAAWMVALSSARMIASSARRLKELELDGAAIDRCGEVCQTALAGRQIMPRSALLQRVEDIGISTVAQRGYHILAQLGWRGLICIGPMSGKEQTFVLLDEWARNRRMLSRTESLVELARRYFTSHGPATVHDFAWWAGQTLTDVRAGLEGAKPSLTSDTHRGTEYWLAADAAAASMPCVSLLAGFDEYLLGYTDRSPVLKSHRMAHVCPGGNGVFFPVMVVDGQIAGTWKRVVTKQKVTITCRPFGRVTRARMEAFEAAAAEYGRFLRLPAALMVLTPPA